MTKLLNTRKSIILCIQHIPILSAGLIAILLPPYFVGMANTLTPQKLYFAYGSNLWLQQMDRRCPTSTYKGLARLSDWRWIINTRGYANVIPSHGDEVWGMIYALPPPDEAKLDVNEGVPFSYQKKALSVETWLGDAAGTNVDISRPGKWETVLCYVDASRVEEAKPKDEYVHRINMGIRDARMKGMPEAFVDKFLRPFIPAEKAGELEKEAKVKIFTAKGKEIAVD